ncbi:MAG: serine/threonine-protein kinase, partial [Planctomycetota bacterium]
MSDTDSTADLLGPPRDDVLVDSSIGPYRLRSVLGEGGFGIVYLAEQTSPVQRRVALKIIKPGMDSKAVIARFHAEEQALALMDHPCVATVFDGGMTNRGLPYFVMELVEGAPITDFCDRHRLTLAERIRLLGRVCDAVQHAHTKGVIHRDLKPSNILVSYDHEGNAHPRVIDFGVAKALNQPLTEATLFTEQGQLIGTPEYMSPEQAEMGATGIDTRTDVYSLGVILYELLTGERPFDATSLRAAGLGEIQRVIREVEPQRPSTRIQSYRAGDTENEAVTRVANARRTEIRTLASVLRRDLDWVVMRALAKERERRYGTASELAADLDRFLNDEPVAAGPPSVGYRVSKFVRRNRTTVAVVGLVALLLAAGLIGTTYGLVQAARDRERATLALSREKERAEELDEVVRFQADMLSSIDMGVLGKRMSDAVLGQLPDSEAARLRELFFAEDYASAGRNFVSEEFIDRSLHRLRVEFTDRPAVTFQLLLSLANLATDASLHHRSTALLDEAALLLSGHSTFPPSFVIALTNERMRTVGARGETIDGQFAAANYRNSVELLGHDHRLTMQALNSHGIALGRTDSEAALALWRQAIERIERTDRNHDFAAVFLANIGTQLKKQGRTDEAEEIFRELVRRGEERFEDQNREGSPALVRSSNYAYSMASLAEAALAEGRLDEALRYATRSLETYAGRFGDDHPNCFWPEQIMIDTLIVQYRNAPELLESRVLPVVQQSLQKVRLVQAPAHHDTLDRILNLAWTYRLIGDAREAEILVDEAIGSIESNGGEPRRWLAWALDERARIHWMTGRMESAVDAARTAAELRRDAFGKVNWRTLRSTLLLCNLLNELGRHTELIEVAVPAATAARERLPKIDASRSALAVLAGRGLMRTGQLHEAATFLEPVLAEQRAASPVDVDGLLRSMRSVAELREGQDRISEAEALLTEAIALSTEWHGEHQWRTLQPTMDLSELLARRNSSDNARSRIDALLTPFIGSEGFDSLSVSRLNDLASWLLHSDVHGVVSPRHAVTVARRAV